MDKLDLKSKLRIQINKNADGWVPLYTNVQAITAKAARIGGKWWPISQMAFDSDGCFYVKRWLYEKAAEEAAKG